MKTIYLLTNFSETSARAIEGFMRVYGDKLIHDYIFYLVNAWKQPRTGHSQMINLDEYLREYSLTDLIKEKNRIEDWFDTKKPNIKIHSEKGDVVDVINRLSEKRKPDLMVMGTKGSSVLRELIAGGTTGRIIRHTRQPTLIIPESISFAFSRRIVFASDLNECKNIDDFEKITSIARRFMAEFMILHIYQEDKPETDEFEKCMASFLEGINYSYHYHQHVNVAEGISQFVQNMGAGLLSMICRSDSLLATLFKNSITGDLAMRAEIPLLIIHE